MGQWAGVAIALVSSALGGTAAAITRHLAAGADPIEMAILRWGIGFVCLLPAAVLLKVKWPGRRDLPGVIALGLCFFGLFFVLYNLATGLAAAPAGSWRGELIMTGAVFCMAFYNVWSRPLMQRSSPLGFLTAWARALPRSFSWAR